MSFANVYSPNTTVLSSNAYSFYRDIKSVFHSSVTCNSTRAEVFLEESLSFRGVRLPLRVAERKGRVKVCNVNVPYEVHKDFATALSTYGEVLTIESEYYAKWESVPTGTRFITMKIKKPIPSLIRVSNYTGRVFYRGQTPTCFKCKEMGHVMQNCHQNANACSRCGSREHSAPQCTCTWGNPPIPLGETNNNNTINANNSTDSQPLANDSSNNEQLLAKDQAEQEENTQDANNSGDENNETNSQSILASCNVQHPPPAPPTEMVNNGSSEEPTGLSMPDIDKCAEKQTYLIKMRKMIKYLIKMKKIQMKIQMKMIKMKVIKMKMKTNTYLTTM